MANLLVLWFSCVNWCIFCFEFTC